VRAGEILIAVEAQLRRIDDGPGRTVYKREWSIGLGETRIDLAAINGSFIGCEIKSARDNFARLPAQVRLYSAVLDKAVLVVEGGPATGRAEPLLPTWWGIWCVTATPDGPDFEVVRRGELNPAPEPFATAQLLWRGEAYALAERRGLGRGLRKATRWRLWETLAAEIPLRTLQHEVREAIRARREW
jgi:hypothetical protein